MFVEHGCPTRSPLLRFYKKKMVTDWSSRIQAADNETNWRDFRKMGCTIKEHMIKNAVKLWLNDDEVKNMSIKLEELILNWIQDAISAKVRHTSY